MNDVEQDQSSDGQQEQGKEPEKVRPTHSVSFARIIGRDEFGNDVLGPVRQIGTIWPRAGREGDGILRFDFIPKEAGVFFTREVSRVEGRRPYRKRSDSET